MTRKPSRVKGRVPCWYWFCTKTQKRVSWVFGSVKQAEKWKSSQCYKYEDHPILEHYLNNRVGGYSREREASIWRIHKERFNSYELKKGVLTLED